VLGGGHDLGNLRPECARCNYSAGATLGNQLRGMRRHPERYAPRRWQSARDW